MRMINHFRDRKAVAFKTFASHQIPDAHAFCIITYNFEVCHISVNEMWLSISFLCPSFRLGWRVAGSWQAVLVDRSSLRAWALLHEPRWLYIDSFEYTNRRLAERYSLHSAGSRNDFQDQFLVYSSLKYIQRLLRSIRGRGRVCRGWGGELHSIRSYHE